MTIKQNINLSKYTTFKIGGNATYFIKVQNLDELKKAIKFSQDKNIKYFILGGGSNILVSDSGYDGLVIKLDGEFKSIEFDKVNQTIKVGAGVLLPHFVKECTQNMVSGFEYLSVIPGTLGAAVSINAGTKRGEIKDFFISCEVLLNDEMIELKRNDLAFAYRSSKLMNSKDIVLSAIFKYKTIKRSEDIFKDIKEYRLERKNRQPKNKKNCGSVFKSHKGTPAGWYIDQCELKGTKVGGAMISNEHANWIVNENNASSQDLLELVELMRNKVNQKFNVMLELEMEYIN